MILPSVREILISKGWIVPMKRRKTVFRTAEHLYCYLMTVKKSRK